MGFETGHKKHGGRKKGTKDKSTVWVLEALKRRGYDYEKELVDALKKASQGDQMALDMLDRLIKLAPHIANKPKEHVAMEGVDELVVKEYVEEKPKDK